MCIIVHKPAGKSVDKATLERCFEANPDGAGYMFIEDGRVWGNKGFMKFKHLIASLREAGLMVGDRLVKDRAITLHFRISTHGGVSKGNCHPFPATSDAEVIKARYWEGEVGVAHNGVIKITPRKGFSDTMEFIAQVISTPVVINNLDDGGVQMALAMATKGSRLFILKADGTFIRTGDWVEEDGILYSNLSYQKKERRAYSQDWALTGQTGLLFPDKDAAPPYYSDKPPPKPAWSWTPKGKKAN